MKKMLTLLAIMAIALPAMAAPVTINVTTSGDTATISWADAAPVAFALDIVPTAGAAATAVSDLNAYYDVFIDYASAQGTNYVYGAGEASAAIAKIAEAGNTDVTDPAGFCISMAGLKDDGEADPASAGTLIKVTGSGTFDIAANAIRGGVVDTNGALEVNFVVDGQSATSFTLAAAPTVCLGDVNNDGWISPDDLGALIEIITPYADDWYWKAVAPGEEAADVNNDDWISPDDLGAIIEIITPYADAWYWKECN